ncbi:MAG: phosphopantetheine adenylyltransferase [Betaproteobacteria bacterium]|nr:phosphopantetheine adenylyltransferase [Betaproteobacteria bacterium]
MKTIIAAGLIVAGIIHLLPLSGVLGAERLATLYGIPFTDANLAILMRHRAVLFGLLGALLVAAAFKPSLQPIALIAGLISVVSFLWLASAYDKINPAIERIVIADWIALGCLLVSTAAYFAAKRS